MPSLPARHPFSNRTGCTSHGFHTLTVRSKWSATKENKEEHKQQTPTSTRNKVLGSAKDAPLIIEGVRIGGAFCAAVISGAASFLATENGSEKCGLNDERRCAVAIIRRGGRVRRALCVDRGGGGGHKNASNFDHRRPWPTMAYGGEDGRQKGGNHGKYSGNRAWGAPVWEPKSKRRTRNICGGVGAWSQWAAAAA